MIFQNLAHNFNVMCKSGDFHFCERLGEEVKAVFSHLRSWTPCILPMVENCCSNGRVMHLSNNTTEVAV